VVDRHRLSAVTPREGLITLGSVSEEPITDNVRAPGKAALVTRFDTLSSHGVHKLCQAQQQGTSWHCATHTLCHSPSLPAPSHYPSLPCHMCLHKRFNT
jgi:hypothetical protein